MKGIVIGGGVAGLSTALALQAAGQEVEVFERRRLLPREDGLFLTLAANGLRGLQQLGALDPVLSERFVPTPQLVFESSSGRILGRTPNGILKDGTPSITLRRGDLIAALAREAEARGIRIHYEHACTSVNAVGTAATVRFRDGREAEADLVVGADGIHSPLRGVVDPAAPAPSFTGLVNLGGICRAQDVPPTVNEMRMLWGTRAFLGYTVDEGGSAWWFANVGWPKEGPLETLAAVSPEAWRERLLALFEEDPPFARRLVSATEHIQAYPILDLPDLPSAWSAGRAVLVGDAAHAVAPSTGQGASLAIEDSLHLAWVLKRERSVGDAFAAYEAERRPRAARMLLEGRRRGAYKAPPNDVARRIRDAVMPMALRLFASERRLAWIHDHTIPWAPTENPRVPRDGEGA